MLQILHNINVDWMGKRVIAYFISGACILISILSLVLHGGPRYGVDFTGGTLVEVSVTPAPSVDAVRQAIEGAGIQGAEIQRLEKAEYFLIRMGAGAGGKDPGPAVRAALEKAHEGTTVEIRRVETVGPRVGGELRGAAIKAVFLALGLILVYVAIRYDWRYSFGAVAALFHDVFIA
ncbi:MAG TPA: protein translocase subunit SecF, partial [Candidatus Eisenbacteria bacterium]